MSGFTAEDGGVEGDCTPIQAFQYRDKSAI
jgi:hypothetical protein